MKKYSFDSSRLHFANENTFFSSFNKPYTLYWNIYLKETKEYIGNVDIRSENKNFKECEIGYVIGEPFQNNGYATECVDSMIQFMSQHFSTIYMNAKFFSSNEASKRVLEKNNFLVVSSRNGLVRVQRKLL